MPSEHDAVFLGHTEQLIEDIEIGSWIEVTFQLFDTNIFGFVPDKILSTPASDSVPKSPRPRWEANQMHPKLYPEISAIREGCTSHCQPMSGRHGKVRGRDWRNRGETIKPIYSLKYMMIYRKDCVISFFLSFPILCLSLHVICVLKLPGYPNGHRTVQVWIHSSWRYSFRRFEQRWDHICKWLNEFHRTQQLDPGDSWLCWEENHFGNHHWRSCKETKRPLRPLCE